MTATTTRPETITETCQRCGGSGSYSYNLRDGDRCYGCEGSGVRVLTAAQVAGRTRRQAASARRQAVVAETAQARQAERAQVRARIESRLEERFGDRTQAQGAYRFYGLCEVAAKAFRCEPSDLAAIERGLG